jgi:hypothetical protein
VLPSALLSKGSSGVEVDFPRDARALAESYAQIKPLRSPDLRVRAGRVLRDELAKYPEQLIRKTLRNIYVFERLMMYGAIYGATYVPEDRALYLTFTSTDTTLDLQRTLHHEFSSLILERFKPSFTLPRLTPLNKPLSGYDTTAIEAVRGGDVWVEPDEKLMKEGYISSYAKVSPEEDFNCISSELFCATKNFWEWVDKYPKLREKVLEVISYYHGIDSRLSEDYFRGLAVAEEASGSSTLR